MRSSGRKKSIAPVPIIGLLLSLILLCVIALPSNVIPQIPISVSGRNAVIYFHASSCPDNINAANLTLCEDLDDGRIWTCKNPSAGGDHARCDFSDEWILNTDSGGSGPTGGEFGVSSFNGRVGAVEPATEDYFSAQIGNVPAGGIASGNVQAALNELDTEKALQSVVSSHVASTTPHGASTANTPDSLVLRGTSGDILLELKSYTIGSGTEPPACNAGTRNTLITVLNGESSTDCTEGDGSNWVPCGCDGENWVALGMGDGGGGGGGGTFTGDSLVSGAGGFKFTGFNSLTKSIQVCNDSEAQCYKLHVTESGDVISSLKVAANWVISIFDGLAAQIKSDAGTILLEITNAGILQGTLQFLEKCEVIDNVSAGLDNRLFQSFQQPVIIKSVWCNYSDTAPTTSALFSLEDGAGNTMTHTSPTCAAPGTAATPQTISAGGGLAAREVLRFDTDNTPNPATDSYMICVAYVLD